MKKKLLYALLGLILLSAAGLGIVLYNLNPIIESFRPTITAKISEAVKANVELGSLKVSLFPSTAVQISDVGLAGAKNKDALRVAKVTLETDLWGLFKSELRVTDLKIKGVRVVATRAADGQISIGSLALGKKREGPPQDAPLPSSPTNEGTTPSNDDSKPQGKPVGQPPAKKNSIDLAVKSASISDATLIWMDSKATPPQEVKLEDLTVDLAEITTTGVGRFAIRGSVLGTSARNLNISGTSRRAEGAALPDAESTIELQNLDLKRVVDLLTAYGVKVDGLGLTESLSFKAAIKAAGGTFAIETNLDASKAGIQFAKFFEKEKDLPFSLTSNATATMLGQIDASKVELRLGDARVQLPISASVFNRSAKAALKTTNLSLSALAATLPMLRALGLEGAFSADLSIDIDGRSEPIVPQVSGTIDLTGINTSVQLGEAGKQPPLKISGVTGKLVLDPDSILAKPIELSVAGQSLNIGAKVTGLKAAHPAVQLAMKSEKIALDPLLASLVAGGVPALAGSVPESLQLAMTFDNAARSGGATVNIERGVLAGLPLAAAKISADFTLNESNQPQSVVLKPSTLGIFGGSLSLQGGLQGDSVTTQARATGLDLSKIMAMTSPGGKVKITGTLKSLNADLRGAKSSFATSVSGPIKAAASEGAISGVNILKQVFEKIDTIPGLGVAALSYVPERYRSIVQSDSTQFRSMDLDATMESGTARINDFTLANELYILSGQGTVVPGGSINLTTQLKLTPVLAESIVLREPRAKLLLDSNNNIVIPVVIRKNGDGPIIALPDVSRLLKMGAKNTAKEAASKALDKVAPGLGGALNSIFK